MALTAQQIADYIKSPYHCPYCLSDDIEGGDMDWDGLTQEVSCKQCQQSWRDELSVTGIIEN